MCGIWGLLSKQSIQQYGKYYDSFMKLIHRGPEYSTFEKIKPNLLIGFHRLAIIDTTERGNQPFHLTRKDGSSVFLVCNGEIYNYHKLISDFSLKCESNSDCEVILHLYNMFGVDKMTRLLDGEFAFIIYDISKNGQIIMHAGRDPIGVRPIFYGYDDNSLCVASEIKGLVDIYDKIEVFPPGKIMTYDTNQFNFVTFYEYIFPKIDTGDDLEIIYSEIRKRLTNAVKKRLISDREVGFLLSGGFDSSIICGIAKKLMPDKKFPVFTIAIDDESPDLHYAKIVAKYLDLDHHIIRIEPEECLKYLDDTIYATESFDITTIRCSIPQLIISKYIKEKTNVRVLFCGENADECCSGYVGFHFNKDDNKMHQENIKLVSQVHKFDGKRTDRTMASNGLEIRLPFADPEFVDYYLSVIPKLRMPVNGLEKFLLRQAFNDTQLLSKDILLRPKNAFSDAISSREKSWYIIIQNYLNNKITDENFKIEIHKYNHCQPYTKESLYYRQKFCEYFSDKSSTIIPYFWLQPFTENKDPSARSFDIFKD
ncbi:Glutamine-dependent asparagine synthetase [uncultured virus]|nr:Glutamine-dependent asparagine synthetase [uncultured virus]